MLNYQFDKVNDMYEIWF